MNTVTVSSKYQVVIPKEIRESIGLKVGTPMQVITYGNRIELIPIRPMKDLDADLSIYAAKVGKEFQLALADSIIYATGLKYGCVIWSQDKHFQELPDVKYFPKRK